MATKLASYTFPTFGRRPTAGSKPRYPWDEWLDGSIWELVKGKDFKGQTLNFRNTIQGRCSARGGELRWDIQHVNGKQILVVQCVMPK